MNQQAPLATGEIFLKRDIVSPVASGGTGERAPLLM